MTTPRPRELPVRRFSMPTIYRTVPKYIPYDPYRPTPRAVGALPEPVGIRAPWPGPPELPFVLYEIESRFWNGTIKVRKMLIDEFGAGRAVPFTVWGEVLKTRGAELEPLFAELGRHEVRKTFVESIRYTRTREAQP